MCDGRELKPKYNATIRDTWLFDGRELKPKYNATIRDTWVVDGHRIKPKYNATSASTYDMGDEPILVVFGQLILRLW